ncbi:MAG: MBL fold metallo-hydrolase [Pseudolabrys sp.]|nr:MBL fold metallo-hydrolase [Pseudolabrys sp.]MSP31465.1 MBL fold metallo-hydrolase [Pseudolabrys sp.]
MSSVAVVETQVREVPFDAELSHIRRLAALLPGPLPLAVNGIRVAASIRPNKFVIEGGDDSAITMPRTAFQVVYPDCTVMIDSGLDQETHDSFSTPDKREPYFPEAFAKLQQALNAARMIVLTHFHADHVVGVTRAANFNELAAKTIVSAETAKCLLTTPHRPHLAMTAEQVNRLTVVGYKQYYPVAPGMALIKAHGHSADHQMVYIALQSGCEILHSVDVGWVLENIRQIKGKAAPWVKEDVPAVMGQLRWLNNLLRNERNVTMLVTHDDDLFASVTRNGLLGSSLLV